jgi:arabinogalactan oligomer/maltooligosaccharide transport system substrate-binding protein
MFNKLLSLRSLVIFLVSTLFLIGCAPDRDEPTDNASNNEPVNEDANDSEEAIPDKPEELTIWVNDSDDDMNSMRELGDRYEADSGIRIELVPVNAREQSNNMSLDASAGRGPDLWFATHNSMGGNILQGLAEPYDIDDDILSEYLPEAIGAMTSDG